MMLVKQIKSAAATVAVGTAILASMLCFNGSANAATTTFKLCNYGSDYSVAAVFPDRGNVSTPLVSPNQCVETSSRTSERFYLRYTNSGGQTSVVYRTYSSGRTLAQTWANRTVSVLQY